MKRYDASVALLQLALKASWRKTWNGGQHCLHWLRLPTEYCSPLYDLPNRCLLPIFRSSHFKRLAWFQHNQTKRGRVT